MRKGVVCELPPKTLGYRRKAMTIVKKVVMRVGVMMVSWLMCLVFGPAAIGSAAEIKFDKVDYMPPRIEGQKKSAEPVKGHVIFDKENRVLEFQDTKGQLIVAVPYDKIKTLLYEKTSRPRYAEAILVSPFFLFSKTKRHFLSIQYTDANGIGAFCMLHMDKSNATDIVNTAEAETGRHIERTEEK